MTSSILRAIPALLLALFTFGFSGCASVGGALPAGLGDVLGGVSGFTDGIANWRGTLGSALSGTQLGQLADYADQAGNLGTQISGLTDGLSDAMANPLGAISSKLQDMSGIDVDKLKNLAPNLQQEAVGAFADSAGSVGTMTSDFLEQFGK